MARSAIDIASPVGAQASSGISAEEVQQMRVGLARMTETLRRLADTMLAEDEYDDEFRPPSRSAYDLGWSTVAGALSECPKAVPDGAAAAIGDGGLQVHWRGRSRQLTLTVPPSGDRSYLYQREGKDDAILPNPSSSELANRLEWLVEA